MFQQLRYGLIAIRLVHKRQYMATAGFPPLPADACESALVARRNRMSFMTIDPHATTDHSDPIRKTPYWHLLALPFEFLKAVGRIVLYCIWYVAFYLLCAFRPFTGMLVLAAIVMLPMSIVVLAHPQAAAGMPFWLIGLIAIGFVAFALGYTMFVDWFTPPGAEDPFERYRRQR